MDASLLIEAFETLTDPKRRAAYDRETFERYVKQAVASPLIGKASLTTLVCPFCKRPLARRARPGESCPTCRIPLQSTNDTGTGNTRRRSVARMKRNGRVLYYRSWPGEAREARAMDLSPKGMRLRCRERLNPGSILKIEDPALRASAVVTNLTEEIVDGEISYSVGISFLAAEFVDLRGSFISISA